MAFEARAGINAEVGGCVGQLNSRFPKGLSWFTCYDDGALLYKPIQKSDLRVTPHAPADMGDGPLHVPDRMNIRPEISGARSAHKGRQCGMQLPRRIRDRASTRLISRLA